MGEDMELNFEEIIIGVNQAIKLKAQILPINASFQKVFWKSSNPQIASISEEGLIKGISPGETDIMASCGNLSAICKVTVDAELGIENIPMESESKFTVFSIEGILIKKECALEELNHLPKGIYIIVSNNRKFKISL